MYTKQNKNTSCLKVTVTRSKRSLLRIRNPSCPICLQSMHTIKSVSHCTGACRNPLQALRVSVRHTTAALDHVGLGWFVKGNSSRGAPANTRSWSQPLWLSTRVFKQHISVRLDLMVAYCISKRQAHPIIMALNQIWSSYSFSQQLQFAAPCWITLLWWKKEEWVNPASPQLPLSRLHRVL